MEDPSLRFQMKRLLDRLQKTMNDDYNIHTVYGDYFRTIGKRKRALAEYKKGLNLANSKRCDEGMIKRIKEKIAQMQD